MVNHLQKWIVYFMKTQERLDKYNPIWLSDPAYHDLTPKNKSYEEISEWNVKEMREMSRYLLGVVTQSLQGWGPSQHPIFKRAIVRTRALLEFYMYARYTSHNDATVRYLVDHLHRFHTFPDVFQLARDDRKAKAKSNAIKTELVKKQMVDEQTHAETWTPSNIWHEINTWQDSISHEINVAKELDADFNFPNIHFIPH